MLTAKEKLSAKAAAKLDLATTIAALALVAATFTAADVVRAPPLDHISTYPSRHSITMP